MTASWEKIESESGTESEINGANTAIYLQVRRWIRAQENLKNSSVKGVAARATSYLEKVNKATEPKTR